MKSISIIGANSYIARNLIMLIKEQHDDVQLYLYDREDVHRDGLHNYTSVDILNLESVEKINFQVDSVIVFSGKTGTYAGFDDSRTFVDVNENSLLNILNAMRKCSSKAKLVFPSTRLVYKGQDGPLEEDGEKEFKTLYAINKYACEQYLKMYNNTFGIQYCIFRICVPYGSLIPGVSSYGTAEFMLGNAKKGQNISLYGKGEVRRTITYIGDLCRILLEGSLSEKCINDVYNVGGEDYSLHEMAELICEKYGVKIEFTPWPEKALLIESGSTVFDSRKLDEQLQCSYEMKFSQWVRRISE